MNDQLPIHEIEGELTHALASPSPRILLRAPTGSGKSTCVPPLLIREGWGGQGLVVVVQPRRMAARLLARYVAGQMGVSLGKEVGYVVRFERRMSPETHLVFVTDGMLERWLTDNPSLDGINAVIFDEFHERRLSGDISLARVLDLQETTRRDLAIVVMSATLEVAGLKEYMGTSCTMIEARGRQFPVDISYLAPRMQSDGRGRMLMPPLWEQAELAIRRAIEHPDCGDILLFMPGVYEIRRTLEVLESKAWLKNWDIYALHGSLSLEDQNRAVSSGVKPRIIVSTNVAETSLTIEGVRTVIDTGVARHAGWDARRGMNTLLIEKISRASADQRAGRAGRVAPGRCLRLWSEAEHGRRLEFEIPEVLRVDLSGVLLTLKYWGVCKIGDFRWLSSPPELTLTHALDLLSSLGAIDQEGNLTGAGRTMLKFPLHPRHAKLMIAGMERQCLPEMAAVVALIEGERVAMREGLDDSLREKTDFTDFQAEWRAVQRAEEMKFAPLDCTRLGIVGRASREILASYKQLLAIGVRGGNLSFIPEPDFDASRDAVIRGIMEGFADYMGVRHGMATNTCRIVGGKSGKLPSHSVAFQGLLFVAGDLSEIGGKGVETHISRCTTISPELVTSLFPNYCSDFEEPVFDETRRRVLIHQKLVYRDLVLIDQEKGDATPEQASGILAEKVADGTLKLNHWDDQVEQWIRRLNGLRQWMPELELPSFTSEDIVVAMSMLCEGAIGYKDIKDREVMPILREWIAPWQREALDQYAPDHLLLSNGQHPKVRYGEDYSPIIALKVQHLFGVTHTPHIANGNKAVKVEVLGPNYRPWQITTSLESFWQTGYPQMRKDLAGRYPKHKWPENL
ncbi:MAG: ATP-dependent helicase HrpB [Akkermansia sp.]